MQKSTQIKSNQKREKWKIVGKDLTESNSTGDSIVAWRAETDKAGGFVTDAGGSVITGEVVAGVGQNHHSCGPTRKMRLNIMLYFTIHVCDIPRQGFQHFMKTKLFPDFSLIISWWKLKIPGASFWPIWWVQFLACGKKVLSCQWGSSKKGEVRKSDHWTNKIPWFFPDLRDFSQIPWLFPDWKEGKSFSSLAGNPVGIVVTSIVQGLYHRNMWHTSTGWGGWSVPL